jgi:DNA-directed RNA polymerase subunit RPC12/RpoP
MLLRLPSPITIVLCVHCGEVAEVMVNRYGSRCSECSWPITTKAG